MTQTVAAYNAQITGRIELDVTEQVQPEAHPPLTREQQMLFSRILDAMTFICKPVIVPEVIVTDAALRAFAVIIKYKEGKKR
jgi:hypothetical protein